MNFVFLHGAGGDSGDMQGLSDQIIAKLPAYIKEYETQNPGIKLTADFLNRCYPNYVDIDTWANNIVDSIDKYTNKKNLILIGHSMGGKTALYATAHNTGGIADKVSAVVTINSPVRAFDGYYFLGGVNYWSSIWMLQENQGVLSPGVLSSIAYYDSAQDGSWVSANSHWLALVSAESYPSSPQFDVSGVDPLPRDMDDEIVPISAQYSEGADVVYYGDHYHSEFTKPEPESEALAGKLADQILEYVFGKKIDVSLATKEGSFGHEASWMPVLEKFTDVVGSDTVESGTITHQNESPFLFQDWEDVVGEAAGVGGRDNYQLHLDSVPFLTSIVDSHWDSNNPEECLVYIKTRAAPRSTVQVDWNVSRNPMLVKDFPRDRYEVELTSGTPFTAVTGVNWLNDNPQEQKLVINSNAEGPFRWFKAQWRTFIKIPRVAKVIDEMR